MSKSRAVLVAISIPIFSAQLEKAREATDVANLRSAYAVGSAEAITQDDPSQGWTKIYTSDGKLVESGTGMSGRASQDGWQGTNPNLAWTSYDGKASGVIKVTYTPGTGTNPGTITVNFAAS